MSVTRMLPVVLTQDELRERGAELATTVEKFERLDSIRKFESKRMKEEIDEIREGIFSLSRVVSQKREDRPVEVIETFDTVKRLVFEVRTDTGEQIGSRSMTVAELAEHEQKRLPFAREEAEAADAAKKSSKKAKAEAS